MKTTIHNDIDQVRSGLERVKREVDDLERRLNGIENLVSSTEEPLSEGSGEVTRKVGEEDVVSLRAPSSDQQSPILVGTPEMGEAASAVPTVVSVSTVPAQAREASELHVSVEETGRAIGAVGAGEETETAEGSRSFEVRLGEYWFVRIGVVLLLTAFGFFGNYAYHRFVGLLGPWGKLGMLMAGSVVMMYAGLRLCRREGALKNYGEVLLGGGFGAVYFTLFAAHYIPSLRVIHQPLVAGILLFGWAGFLVWVADYRRLNVMGMFALGLAYYTTSIQPVAWFGLLGNLILSIAAVGLMVRRGWTVVSLIGLLATYGGYGYWRYGVGGGVGGMGAVGVWMGTLYSVAYWVVFTVGVFLGREVRAAAGERARLAILNNAGFTGLVALGIWREYPAEFWVFPAVMGCVFLVLSRVAGRVYGGEPGLGESYRVQGHLMCTWAIMALFSGAQMAVTLGLQAVTGLWISERRDERVGRALSWLGLLVATGTALEAVVAGTGTVGWVGGLLLGTIFGICGALLPRWEEGRMETRWSRALLAILGGLLWVVSTMKHVDGDKVAMVLGVEALVMLGAGLWGRYRAMIKVGQAVFVVANWAWIVAGDIGGFWAIGTGVLTILNLGAAHLWQWFGGRVGTSRWERTSQGLHTYMGVWMAWALLRSQVGTENDWVWMGGALSTLFLAYAWMTRLWSMAWLGQMPLWMGNLYLIHMAVAGGWDGNSVRMLVPVGWTWGTGWLLGNGIRLNWWQGVSEEGRERIRRSGVGYRGISGGLLLLWLAAFAPEGHRAWMMLVLSGVLMIGNPGGQDMLRTWAGRGYGVVGVLACWFSWASGGGIWVRDLGAIFLFLAQQQVARRMPGRYAISENWGSVVVIMGWLSVWGWISGAVSERGGGFYLTVAWTLFSGLLMAAGLALRERGYRRVGLTVLGAALCRVLLLDVWQLDPLPRILGFLALGVVMVLLGFVYNRYRKEWQRWL